MRHKENTGYSEEPLCALRTSVGVILTHSVLILENLWNMEQWPGNVDLENITHLYKFAFAA